MEKWGVRIINFIWKQKWVLKRQEFSWKCPPNIYLVQRINTDLMTFFIVGSKQLVDVTKSITKFVNLNKWRTLLKYSIYDINEGKMTVPLTPYLLNAFNEFLRVILFWWSVYHIILCFLQYLFVPLFLYGTQFYPLYIQIFCSVTMT